MKVRIFVEPQQGATYERLLTVAQEAEACGFDAFFRSDHYLTMGGDGLPGPTDAWLTLGAIARETSRIRLGTLVSSSTFRWPGVLAITVAQVDAMSGGRIELGLGTGWYEGEHKAYGIPFPPLGERFERLEEQLSIITGLWDTPAGETYSFSGEHYQLVDSPALPKPVQQPHPPVVIGGGGTTRTPRLAATFADEFNLAFHGVAETEAQFARVRAACTQIGRDPGTLGLSAAQVVCCGADEAEVARRARSIGREVAELRTNGAAGTPDEVVARCQALGGGGRGHDLPPGSRPRGSRPHPAPGRQRGTASGVSAGSGPPGPGVGVTVARQPRPRSAGRCAPPAGVVGVADAAGLAFASSIRASVLPPTAMQPLVVGQSSAVRGSGVYSVVDAMKDPPPLRLCATPPMPMAGLPTHLVPTMAHRFGEGHATP